VYIYNIYAAREKPEDYKNFEGFASLWEISVTSIWNLFAKKAEWQYIEDFDILRDLIEKLDEDCIFVMYCAGNLDYLVRERMS
jgi:UDP-N-acetylmuramate-alanine ligase